MFSQRELFMVSFACLSPCTPPPSISIVSSEKPGWDFSYCGYGAEKQLWGGGSEDLSEVRFGS